MGEKEYQILMRLFLGGIAIIPIMACAILCWTWTERRLGQQGCNYDSSEQSPPPTCLSEWELGQQRCSYSSSVEPYHWHCKGVPISFEHDITTRTSPDERYFVTLYSHGEEIVVEVQEAINDDPGKTVFDYTYTHYAEVFVTNTLVEWDDNSEEFSFDYDFTYKEVRTECVFSYNIPNDKFVLQCTNPDD